MVDWAGEGKVMPDFAKLEGKKSKQEGDLPVWAARQQKVFTNWINNKVADDARLTVTDLFVDLQDGTVLYRLLEVLSKQSLAVLGKVKPERIKIKKIANMSIVWTYLTSTVKLVGIGPTDIVDGNVTLTLGMIWSLIVFFMAKDLGDAGDGLNVLKKRIMEWITKRTRHYPDVEVTNFTDSLADGRALLAILDDQDPSESPYDPTDSPAENLKRAFEDFRRLYGVGAILDPDDPQCCADEKANITYLAEVMKAMPGFDEEGEGGEGGRTGARVGRRLRGEAAVDTQQAALKRAEEAFPETVEKLRELCAFGPRDGKACADKVAEMMMTSGLTDVKVVTPSQDREDPSMRGDAFVVGEKAGPPGTPTVLLYASYGTVDESKDGRRKKASSAAIERWASDPLCLTDAEGGVEAGGGDGARLVARGASQDKANVVCQMAAVEALTKGTLPCGVKIIVGASPPPGSLVGNTPLDVADRLADFLRAHPAATGRPDLVVVSEPSGARLAPGKNALLVGCRGFATLQVSVSTFSEEEEDETRTCAAFAGPLIDPARVLTTILASMHDPETGGLKVEGISGPPTAALADRLKDLIYGERQLRSDSDYAPQVACAKEVYQLEQDVKPTVASIVDQLTLLPAVTVTSLSTTPNPTTGGGGGGGLLESAFPVTANAEIHMCLPPGEEYASAVQALQEHCVKHTPHRAKVRFEKVVGRTGWLAPGGSPIVEGVLASIKDTGDGEQNRDQKQEQQDGKEMGQTGRGGEGEGEEGGGWGRSSRETVAASNPGFSPTPSAFSRALPAAVVVGLGVNDPEAKGGMANESVLVDDLKGFVQGAIRLLHGVAKGGGDGATAVAAEGAKERADDAPGGYTNRFIDDVARRNAVNQMRGKRSAGPSPCGSATTSPRGPSSLAKGVTNSFANAASPVRTAPASPLFSNLERGTGGMARPAAKHPLSPARVAPSLTPTSTSSATGGAMGGVDPSAAAAIAKLLESTPLGPRVPPPPVAPSAAMAAYAAAALGQAGVGGGGGGGGGGMGALLGFGGGGAGGMGMGEAVSSAGGVAGEEDDDKVGGGTPETVLAEINELRADPRGYVSKLEPLVQLYDKTMYQSPTGPPVQTTEGVKPLLEAIATLKTTAPLEPMEAKEGMQQASADHVKDLASTSRTGHSGSDGSGAADRMNRYGQFFQVAGEVCTYFDATAEGIVAQLLVSDGERSRHNRKALLAAHFKVCGVAIGTHPTVGAACVITLAGGYGPRPLAQSADVVCGAGEKPTAEFREVLESVPVPQITEEVKKCLQANLEVQLQYAPGQIKCIFVQPSGARKSMGCKWA